MPGQRCFPASIASPLTPHPARRVEGGSRSESTPNRQPFAQPISQTLSTGAAAASRSTAAPTGSPAPLPRQVRSVAREPVVAFAGTENFGLVQHHPPGGGPMPKQSLEGRRNRPRERSLARRRRSAYAGGSLDQPIGRQFPP